jgi:transcriptional regulator with XRE-family HTH domain
MDRTASPLRAYRKAQKLTLGVLSEPVGVTPGQLSRIERFGTTSLPTALKLAEITGLPVADFAPRETVG